MLNESATTTTADRLLDHLATAVLVFDADLRLRYINHAGEVLLEHSRRSAFGRKVEELFLNALMVEDQLTMALHGDQVIVHRGCSLHLPAHEPLLVNCTATPVSWSDGSNSVMLEMRKVKHHLRIEHDEVLINQQQAVRDLVRGLAHEIKNPLGGLRGAAQLLEREIGNSDLTEYTSIIIDQADRLQVLMDRMLGPNNLPKIESVNIHEVLERVRSLLAVECGDTLAFVKDYDPSLPELQADNGMLEQAVLNIMRNAGQAIDCQGTIHLRTRVKRNFNIGERLHKLIAAIDIIDDGPGIDSEMRGRIFYPMVTGRSDGTGLGLPIAQTIISRHGGLIECNSVPGKTVFTILLPLTQPDHEQ